MGLYRILLALIVLISLASCAITNEYGPFRGKVIDAETNEPIEGAVVFVQFFTEFMASPGGVVTDFADAIEVLTDSNGEFEIPAQRLVTFRLLHRWDPYESVIIFKPGYGAYPKHPGIERNLPDEDHLLPKEKFVIIKLPKLKTNEERLKNLRNAGSYSFNIPPEKYRHILELSNQESIELGLQPMRAPAQGVR